MTAEQVNHTKPKCNNVGKLRASAYEIMRVNT